MSHSAQAYLPRDYGTVYSELDLSTSIINFRNRFHIHTHRSIWGNNYSVEIPSIGGELSIKFTKNKKQKKNLTSTMPLTSVHLRTQPNHRRHSNLTHPITRKEGEEHAPLYACPPPPGNLCTTMSPLLCQHHWSDTTRWNTIPISPTFVLMVMGSKYQILWQSASVRGESILFTTSSHLYAQFEISGFSLWTKSSDKSRLVLTSWDQI